MIKQFVHNLNKLKIIIVSVVAMCMLSACTSTPEISQNTPKICTTSTCIDVEIADTAEKRQVGLMNRNILDTSTGMLFIFDSETTHEFWMKNTHIPLDIIWIDKNFTIVDIQTATPCEKEPCEIYTPQSNATYALEINANKSQEFGFNTGEAVYFKNINTTKK